MMRAVSPGNLFPAPAPTRVSNLWEKVIPGRNLPLRARWRLGWGRPVQAHRAGKARTGPPPDGTPPPGVPYNSRFFTRPLVSLGPNKAFRPSETGRGGPPDPSLSKERTEVVFMAAPNPRAPQSGGPNVDS